MGEIMQKAFTKPEQIKLLEHPHIDYVSKRVVRFSTVIRDEIKLSCKSSPDIRAALRQHNIPEYIITTRRVHNLYTRYVSGRSTKDSMPRKYFSDIEIKNLEAIEVIIKVNKSTITYSPEFKVEIASCPTLTDARTLFNKYEIPIDIIGDRRFENAYYRLRDQKRKKGNASFSNEQRGRKAGIESFQYSNLTDSEKVSLLEKRLTDRDEEVAFLKKYMPSLPVSKIKNKHWYEAIKMALDEDGCYVPYRLCKAAGVDSSGYYRYIERIISPCDKHFKDAMILADITHLQTKHKMKLGYRQITMQLNILYVQVGFDKVNSKRILRLMRENRLLSDIRSINPHKHIWKATVEDKVSPNKLKRDFKTGIPLEKLLTDITYLPCAFGWSYLSAVKDSVTNEIVTYTVKDNMKLPLSLEIAEGLAKIKLAPNVLLHSDQGVHYTAKKFRLFLEEHNIIQSMSRRGNCWDNAPMESFFGHMKDEIDFMQFQTLEEVQTAVDNYVIYYNYERPQWNLKKLSPVDYRKQFYVNIKVS